MNESVQDNLILIVEDDAHSYILIKEFLNDTGVKTIRAENGKQAVDIIKENQSVNLVLMDIRLPILNGFDATTEIKKMRQNIPVIFQTANGLTDEMRKFLLSDNVDYLLKPYKKSDLQTKINNFISLS